jgi:predicted transcriptional regulator
LRHKEKYPEAELGGIFGRKISPDTELWTALRLMDRHGVNPLPVMIDSQVVGILSREDVITFLRTV